VCNETALNQTVFYRWELGGSWSELSHEVDPGHCALLLGLSDDRAFLSVATATSGGAEESRVEFSAQTAYAVVADTVARRWILEQRSLFALQTRLKAFQSSSEGEAKRAQEVRPGP
jgi:hypothetical protein